MPKCTNPACKHPDRTFTRIQADWYLRSNPQVNGWCEFCVIERIINSVKPLPPKTYYEPPTGWKH